jgi:hypothetical protein
MYRNVRNGLPEKSGFLAKRAYFDRKMAENAGKKAENLQNPGSEYGSNRPLQIAIAKPE